MFRYWRTTLFNTWHNSLLEFVLKQRYSYDKPNRGADKLFLLERPRARGFEPENIRIIVQQHDWLFFKKVDKIMKIKGSTILLTEKLRQKIPRHSDGYQNC